MSTRAPRLPDGLPPATPVVVCDVPGPRGQTGCLLRAPRHETLEWDLENEIASSRQEWLDEQRGWWVAASYLDTLIDLVLRSFASVVVLDPVGGDRLVSRAGKSKQKVRPL